MLKKLKRTFNDFNLSRKFNTVLLTVLVFGVITSGVSFSFLQESAAEKEVTQQALLLMETMNSVRQYTSEHVKPLLASQQQVQEEFIAETVPAYSANTVFANFTDSPDFEAFSYREATLNPTNLNDLADDFEEKIVTKFREQLANSELKGFRTMDDGKQFYIARPIAIGKESCLECHGVPANAPAAMLVSYGDQNGFGWELNEIVGAQIISVPAGEVFSRAQRSVVGLMVVTTAIFVLAIYLVNLLLNRTVIDRLISLSLIADQVSKGAMSVDFEATSQDEIGRLGNAFNRLKRKFIGALRKAREQAKT